MTVNSLVNVKWMGKENGGLHVAHHAMECQNDINWENAKIIAKERELRKRKVHEGNLSHYRRNTME